MIILLHTALQNNDFLMFWKEGRTEGRNEGRVREKLREEDEEGGREREIERREGWSLVRCIYYILPWIDKVNKEWTNERNNEQTTKWTHKRTDRQRERWTDIVDHICRLQVTCILQIPITSTASLVKRSLTHLIVPGVAIQQAVHVVWLLTGLLWVNIIQVIDVVVDHWVDNERDHR